MDDFMKTFLQSQADSKRAPTKSRPQFVTLHPKDDGAGLPDVFFGHPANFKPKFNKFGEAQHWGLYECESGYPEGYEQARTGFGLRKRRMQMHYLTSKFPEEQFVMELMKKKSAALMNLRLGDLLERDYILRISMMWITGEFGEDLIYRRFKVSGGINLDTLQDKIICPIMGWTRNAHAYGFCDTKDGSCFGPENSQAVDLGYKANFCHEYLPAQKYNLAHLVQKEGESILYMYDFGDMWLHRIKVEKILPKSKSNGSVELIEGRGMCPREDGGGPHKHTAAIYTLKHGSNKEKQEIIEQIQRSGNYKDQRITLSTFDPAAFPLSRTRQVLSAALKSKASVREGPKVMRIPLSANALSSGEIFGDGIQLKKGQEAYVDMDPQCFPGIPTETISTRRDRLKKALCASCGSPNNLKACAGCRKIFYCGPGHQRLDWKAHKAECIASRKASS